MGKREIDIKTVESFNVAGGLCVPEMLFLIEWCENYECKQYIEIGRRLGGSTRLLSLLASRAEGKLISVDGNAQYLEGVKNILIGLGLINYVEFITGFSPWIQFDMSWEFDFLLVDGDHRFIPTIVDYHTFNYFVKKGGLIAFHDIHLEFTCKAMMKMAVEDDLKFIDRKQNLQLWEKTQPRGRKRQQSLKELRAK